MKKIHKYGGRKMQVVKCNKCGKEMMACEQKFSINHMAPYRSMYYGNGINFDLCGKCLDSILEEWNKTFTYSPFQLF